MKTVILMRHAKSSWSDIHLDDHQRPLNERGKADAPIMADRLKSTGHIPQFIYSSDSRRTRETYEGLAGILGSIPVSFQSSLYHASAGQILRAIHQANNTHSCIMILAHNPGITDAFELLAKVRVDNVPTSGIGVFEFEHDQFSEILPGKGRMVLFDYPKLQ